MRQPMGQLIDCENRGRRYWSDFTKLWARVKEGWRDQRCQQFEREHLAELPAALNRLAAASQEMQETLRRTERDLADPDRPDAGWL
jgi:hypothetical protein